MNEATVAKLVAGGEGLAFLEGKAVFVPGVLPGERVRLAIVERRRDFDRAVLESVLEPSPRRVAPGCPYAEECGGCNWQHIGYEEQLRQKRSIVAEALRRSGGIQREQIPIVASPAWGFRNRAQIHADGTGGFGYMAARSNRVVAVGSCPILADPLNRIFSDPALPPPDVGRFIVFGAGDWIAVEGRDDGRDLRVRVGGREIRFSVGCFFQSNLAVLGDLVAWALDGLSGGAAADLYCGVGLFGSFLAGRFRRIFSVESNAMSLSYARLNVSAESERGAGSASPGPRGHEFHPMSVEQWILSGAARLSAGREPLDAVVVDPPRAGLAPEVRSWLTAAAPRRLVYVSCNPVTLARDLGALVAGGFTLEDLRLFDFTPQTSHVESVARLSFGGAP